VLIHLTLQTELLDQFIEKDPIQHVVASTQEREEIGFRRATFTWTNESEGSQTPLTPSRRSFRLNVEQEIVFQKGAINLIAGPTGSGKTSMLLALLGELHFLPSGPDSWFSLPRGGGVAYAAQESWVLNDTIKVKKRLASNASSCYYGVIQTEQYHLPLYLRRRPLQEGSLSMCPRDRFEALRCG
jgi:hypothetical protein